MLVGKVFCPGQQWPSLPMDLKTQNNRITTIIAVQLTDLLSGQVI